MRILIDILHPAHVHLFRNFIKQMEKKGHNILVTARDKDVAIKLLNAYKIKHIVISKAGKGIGLFFELLSRNLKLIKIIKEFKPDFLTGNVGTSIALVSLLTGVPSIVFHNNESVKLTNPIVYRLAKYVVTAKSYEGKVQNKNHITYDGCHELAYLHPSVFNPDKKILNKIKLKKNQKLIIVRFVALQAVHDVGVKGISNRLGLVKELEKYGKVVITSEQKLAKEFEKYRINVPVEKLHDLLAFSDLCIGESATLASESAVLGIPSIYVCDSKRGYTNEQEKRFGLVFNFSDENEALKKTVELLKRKNVKKEFQEKRKRLLKEQVNLTKWMVNFFEGLKK